MAGKTDTWLGTTDRYARLRRIEELDPERDAREITELFFADFQSAMFPQSVSGYLLTFAAPRMSRILDSTGQLEHQVAKRFVDTAILTGCPMEHGFGPGQGRDAARRVNAMHRRYPIHPDDFVVVGCDVPVSAVENAEKFGWRPVSEHERAALPVYHNQLARAFGSRLDLPTSLAAMRAYWDNYLNTELAFEPQNRRLALAVLAHVASFLPKPLRPVVRPLLLAQVDPRVVEACGLAVPSKPIQALSGQLLKAMGRKDPVPDGRPDGLAALAAKVYPTGWDIERLGTHDQVDPAVPVTPARP